MNIITALGIISAIALNLICWGAEVMVVATLWVILASQIGRALREMKEAGHDGPQGA